MSRNAMAHFGAVPSLDIKRSRFPLNHTVKLSGNVGDVLPIDCFEVLPGDTFKIRTNKVIRFQTMLTPIMDNIVADVFWFYAPSRILWDHFKQFFGESERAWYPAVTYTIPTLNTWTETVEGETVEHNFMQGSIADYLGVPPGVANLKVNALPFRMYSMICNEYFRDQNLEDPLLTYTGDDGKNCATSETDTPDQYSLGGMPFKAAKLHDTFTSCLPGAQKGPAVEIPGGFVNLVAPVIASDIFMPESGVSRGVVKLKNSSIDEGATKYIGYWTDTGHKNMQFSDSATGTEFLNLGIATNNLLGEPTVNQVVNGTINQLRMAFQVQKLLERDGRAGSRYRELIRSHFGVTAPDASLQIPQYLGGNRFPIVVHQIANTGETETAKLGNVGAMSVTSDTHEDLVFSSQEAGYIMCILVLRYNHTYAQGLHRMWSKKSRYDLFWPEFSQAPSQAVYTKEIDAKYGNTTWTDSSVDPPVVHNADRVFGFQEAWYDYRYLPDRCCAEMRPQASNTLATWHLADYYDDVPYLSPDWIKEDKSNVDRVLAVTSSVSNQFWADFYFDVTATRPLPLYSIPGLADHY